MRVENRATAKASTIGQTYRKIAAMFTLADYELRPLAAADESILWEMLYLGLRSGQGEELPREIVHRPEYARYVQSWGRSGDTGFIARDKESGVALGAVWLREPANKETTPDGMPIRMEKTRAVIDRRRVAIRALPCGSRGDRLESTLSPAMRF